VAKLPGKISLNKFSSLTLRQQEIKLLITMLTFCPKKPNVVNGKYKVPYHVWRLC